MRKRRQWCRACGEDKGHSFGSCKNGRGLREIIRLQDGELKNATETLARLREEVKQLEKQAAHAGFLYRVSVALLDARG